MQEEAKGAEKKLTIIKGYLATIEDELRKICDDIMKVLGKYEREMYTRALPRHSSAGLAYTLGSRLVQGRVRVSAPVADSSRW